MVTSQINLLEKELTRLADEINVANVSKEKNTEHITNLNHEYHSIKKTLAKYRVQEFEEREFLDFDDDLR
jgi:hypothetical protein